MNPRIILFLIVSLFTAGTCAAEESAKTRAARYYAEGLERPLLLMRKGSLLIQACQGRLRKACDEEQAKLAAGNPVLTLLDALTLFPQRLETDPAAGIEKASELARRIAETSEALLREAGSYDIELFARYHATLDACPYDDPAAYATSLQALEELNYSRFQSLDPQARAQAFEDAGLRRAQAADSLRRLPRDECLATRSLGEYLMQLMHSKLRPWSEETQAANPAPAFDFNQPKKSAPDDQAKQPKDRELAHAVAGNFVAVVATELQLQVFPESAPRIKEIADRAGFPSED